MARRLKPPRLDRGFLIGWFLPEAGGNHKKARSLSDEYLRRRSENKRSSR
jgi:hypothetical protein